MSPFARITKADLAAWRDDQASITDPQPSDPAEHCCMYNDALGTPVSARIKSR